MDSGIVGWTPQEFFARYGEQPDPTVDLAAALTWHQRVIYWAQARRGLQPAGREWTSADLEACKVEDPSPFLPRHAPDRRSLLRLVVDQGPSASPLPVR